MRKCILTACFLVTIIFANGQTRTIPSVEVKDLTGKIVNTADVLNKEGLTIIDFWATWCKPCIQELDNIADVYPKWQKETGVKIIAVSVDDVRNIGKIGPMVKGRDWPYEILVDSNSDLKRALNVSNIPHTFLLNKKGEIIWQHNSYSPGDEDELFELLKTESQKK